jgi:hypothetical protein
MIAPRSGAHDGAAGVRQRPFRLADRPVRPRQTHAAHLDGSMQVREHRAGQTGGHASDPSGGGASRGVANRACNRT